MSAFQISEVFLVDDDDLVNMVSRKILISLGFKNPISSFENGKSALNEINRRIADRSIDYSSSPVLILLDINMPVMNAWGFLVEFSKLDPEIKAHFLIVILTSSIETSDQNMAFSFPDVRDYFTKPLLGKYVTDFLGKLGLYIE